MSENYNDAAVRHWEDAELLIENERLENADHHYGFAAECALKTVLRSLNRFKEDEHRKHINVLWNKMQATAFQRHFPGLARILSSKNHFEDWDVEQRYYANKYTTDDAVQAHRNCAKRLLVASQVYRG